MFGYVRPDVPELKIKDFERYRACYCGLCHELGDRYGMAARLTLNYDFVFLAMLLWHEEEPSDYCLRRCAPSPLRKKCVCCTSRAITVCAGYSVILAYWKLCDSVMDNGLIKALPDRLARLMLERDYRRAAERYAEFDKNVREKLGELAELERSGEKSLDRSADKFASLLASTADAEEDATLRRILREILYHVGRIIYIVDAYDDLEEDFKALRYNPIAVRFSLSGAMTEEVRGLVRGTLDASTGKIWSAYELLPRNYWSDITDNIVYRGLPVMCRDVLNGVYNRKKKYSKRIMDNGLG